MIISKLSESLAQIDDSKAYMYFITRVLKPEHKKTDRVLRKFEFRIYEIDINDEIRQHLFMVTQDQLAYLAEKKMELAKYDVLSDDTEFLFTYSMENKAMSFKEIVEARLAKKATIPRVTNLGSLIDQEELWAYCIAFNTRSDDWFYTFRKILAGKIAIDEQNNVGHIPYLKTIRTHFNTRSSKLELIHGETINLDKQIDCIYYEGLFYIAQKQKFEQIVGLEEEYKEEAEQIVEDLRKTKMIVGLDVMKDEIGKGSTVQKQLVRLAKIGNYKKMGRNEIVRIKEVAREFGEPVKFKDGKLLIENEKDVRTVIRMLSDYYKEGKVSGRPYGTYSGRLLED